MDSKTKILIAVLAIGTIIIGVWWIRNMQIEVDCSEITSLLNIEKCIGERIKAIGILECEKPGLTPKTGVGVHYLKFEDGTELRFLEEYPNCKSYDGKKVRVVGEFSQGAGVGLVNIESVNLFEDDEEIIKKLILGNISKFENTTDARISFDQIEIKGNRAFVEIFIRWGEGLGVGYRYTLIKVYKRWIIASRKRTIVE